MHHVLELVRRVAVDFGTWWPRSTHSVGGERVKEIVLEPKVGGRICEEHLDGRRFQWGTIVQWEPPPPAHMATTRTCKPPGHEA